MNAKCPTIMINNIKSTKTHKCDKLATYQCELCYKVYCLDCMFLYCKKCVKYYACIHCGYSKNNRGLLHNC
jgi:hypothetical protein